MKSEAVASETLSKEERIQHLGQPFWIGYPRAELITERLEEVFHHPKMHRMPNLAIIGETNNGKTLLLKRFCKKHAPTEEDYLREPTLPVLMVLSPPEPQESRLYGTMLEKLFSTAGTRETAASQLRRIKVLLGNLNCGMIVLDEFHHTLAGTGTKVRRYLNGIKNLGTELEIPIVVAGTPETLNVLQADGQIANRFEPLFLPKWEFDQDFLRLLVTIEGRLKLLNPSRLHEPALAKRLHDESEGIIGELMKLLQRLAKEAIRSGHESIHLEMLQHDYLKKIGWKSPSVRNRYPG